MAGVTVAQYKMDGNNIYLLWNGIGYHCYYRYVQEMVDDMAFNNSPNLWVWQGALRFLREHLAVTPDGELVAL